MNFLQRIYYGFINVTSVSHVKRLGLVWKENIYGDRINMTNARSLWFCPKTKSYFYCNELLSLD